MNPATRPPVSGKGISITPLYQRIKNYDAKFQGLAIAAGIRGGYLSEFRYSGVCTHRMT